MPEAARPAADPRAFVTEDKGASAHRLELLVRGARCAGCLSRIEAAARAVPSVSEARMNLSTGRLSISWTDPKLDPRRLVEAVSALGYTAAPFDAREGAKESDKEGRALLMAMTVSGVAAMNVMMFSVPIWSANFNGEMGESTRTMFHWLSAAIALPAGAYAGMPFFRNAWSALRRGHANMDVPISLAVILAAVVSLWETATGGLHAYFDAVVMLLFLLLIGRYLDHRLRLTARRAARDLLALQAVTATVLDGAGQPVSMAVKDVQPGFRLLVHPGDRVPVDVEIEEGSSDADFSLLTGETAPVPVGAGMRVRAGAVNLTGALVARATAAAEDSFLAEIARLVEAGEQSRSRYVRLADAAARLYVPLVHGAALLTAVGWLLAGGDMRTAILNACAVLIITCPCALGLAVPAVQVVASGRLFRDGILVRTGDALERLAVITHAVFDKTGVLTRGLPGLSQAPDAAALADAARLARASRHPLARALARAAGPGPVESSAREVPGQGVEAMIDGAAWRLGRADFVGAGLEAGAETELWFARPGSAPLRFAFTDTLRADAASTVATLAARGIPAEVVSGDRPGPVAQAAAGAGITGWTASALPAGKAARLDELAAQGHKVLMVGDGLNDAPALAAAHVSMAPGAAADASQSAADFVFQGEELGAVARAHAVARAARARIRENFAFSVLYNIVTVPIAMAGLVTPFIAAIAMSASSLVVMLNALRLAGPVRAPGAETTGGSL
jgi:Cu2+-exporting ATPase